MNQGANQGANVGANVAIFGGSFNPPHIAHLLATAWVVAAEEIDHVLVVPTFRHPFAKDLAPFDARVTMCDLAMGSLPCVEISKIEEELGGESRTLRTLERLQEMHSDWKMRLVIGGDLVAESSKWHRFEDIQKLAPPIVLGRVGFEEATPSPAVLPDVSSTDVRRRVNNGEWMQLRKQVPTRVLAFIREHRLYGAA